MTRTAIATGASGGIGRGIAERLAKDGFCSRRTLCGKHREGRGISQPATRGARRRGTGTAPTMTPTTEQEAEKQPRRHLNCSRSGG